jgi:hypothetical protein
MVIRGATCFVTNIRRCTAPVLWHGAQTQVTANGNPATVEDTIQYDLSTCYTQIQRPLNAWLTADAAHMRWGPKVSTFVLIVRTLSHQLRMPHFLELLIKVALSVTLDYPFQK